MKIEIVDRSIDRQLLTAMVVSPLYLRETRDIYSSAFFSSSYMQIVANWCYDYFEKYEEAPGRHIQDIFDANVRGDGDAQVRPEELDLIQKFLGSISKEYDASAGLNVAYLLDETEKWWQKQDLKNLIKQVEETLKTASPEDAETLIRKHTKLERAVSEGFDFFNDPEGNKILFQSQQTPLIEFGGALGEIINPWMTRDQLIGVLAPPKAGKTALLAEACVRAIAARCNVALFETGDLSEQQTRARVFSNLTGSCTDDRYIGKHKIAVLDCWKNQNGECLKKCRQGTGCIRTSVEDPYPFVVPKIYKPCSVCKSTKEFMPCYAIVDYDCESAYTETSVDKMRIKMRDYMGLRSFRGHVSSNSSTSVTDIHKVLEKWKNQIGFIPDVIVIDYADILASEPDVNKGDERSKQNARWQKLRKLSQDWHALVIVATQSDANGFGKEDLSFENFSEDMRKYAHVTGMLALHQTEYEKERGMSRLSWILGREGQPGRMSQAVVLHNHYIGRFHNASFRRDQNYRAKFKE